MYFYEEDETKVVLYEVRPYRLDACWYLFVFINIGYFFLGLFSKKYKADFGKQAFLKWLSKRVPWWTNATVYPPGTTFEWHPTNIVFIKEFSFMHPRHPEQWWL